MYGNESRICEKKYAHVRILIHFCGFFHVLKKKYIYYVYNLYRCTTASTSLDRGIKYNLKSAPVSHQAYIYV